MISDTATPAHSDAATIVLKCVNAINAEDFDTARTCAADNMKFEGVLGSRDGAGAYFDDMRKMKLKYDVIRVFANADDVCLLYDLHMDGMVIFGCGWYHVTDGKIDSLKVLFDPRKVVEQKGQ